MPSNLTLVFIIVAAVVVTAFIVLKKKKPKISPLVALNRSLGLPDDFAPPQYLGPGRPGPVATTPGGITLVSNGFDRPDIPEYLEALRARVIHSEVDALWRRVRDEAPTSQDSRYSKLTAAERSAIKALPNNKPYVTVMPSIWVTTSNFGYGYVGGLTMASGCQVAVWYKSTLTGTKTNWEGYMYWEFVNVALFSIGRGDQGRLRMDDPEGASSGPSGQTS